MMIRQVPFLDLKAQYAEVGDLIEKEVISTLRSTNYSNGEKVQEFEKKFADYCGAKHCVAVNSGTSALHLILKSLGVGDDITDEVITVSHTFIATAWAISYCGARPVFVDVDQSGLMDLDMIESKITDKTKAIVPVHLYGNVVNLTDLDKLSQKFGIPIVEDAAQAHGASHGDLKIGKLSSAASYSFYPGKNLGAVGEAGAVTTNDTTIANRLVSLRNHAQEERYIHKEIGFNYRMDSIQAAALLIKLRKLDGWRKKRGLIVERYKKLLTDVEGVDFHNQDPKCESANHLFVLHVKNRNDFRSKLATLGVSTGLHYPKPVHLQTAYSGLGYSVGDLPMTEKFAAECVSLPLYPELNWEDVDYVISSISDILNEI